MMNVLGYHSVAKVRRFVMNKSNQHFAELDQLIKLAIEQLKLLGYGKKSLYRYTTCGAKENYR